MTTSATAPAVRAAFGSLIDYAGMFPPAGLGVRDALETYAAARSGPHAWMLGRFLVPADGLSELGQARQAAATNDTIPVSVIIPANRDAREWFGRVQVSLEAIQSANISGTTIDAIEAPLPALLSQRESYDAPVGQFAAAASRAGVRGIPAFLEVPAATPEPALSGALGVFARYGVNAKIRCGGTSASAFPDVAQVAAFLRAAAAAEVPFKATAGLHHPIRRREEASGFEMHGFLNLLAGAVLAEDEDADVEGALADREAGNFSVGAGGLRWRGHDWDVADIERLRARFVSYGSCSFEEPVRDLQALNILE